MKVLQLKSLQEIKKIKMVNRPFFLYLKSAIIVNKGMFIMLKRIKSKKEEQIIVEDAPKGFVYKKTKKISSKKVKRQNTITTLLFFIGFLLPTGLAIYKKMNMDQTSSFEQYYFYIFIGLIILDILIYLPIFFINKSLVRKSNHKKMLLTLLTIRKIEKLVMAIYSLSFIFYGLPKDSFSFSLSGVIAVIKSNIVMSVLSVVTALTSLLSKNKRLVNEVSSELLKTNMTLEKYEYDKSSGDVIVKVYKRIGKRSIRKAMLAKLLTKLVSLVFSIGVLILLVYLLLNI